MNQCVKRVKHALKVGILTSVFVFAGFISPFAFVTAPLTDAQVNGIYEIAVAAAFIGFVVQVPWIVFQKQKL